MLLGIATLVSPARAAAGGTISGAEFARRVLSGESLNGMTVSSDVDLSGKSITHQLICRGCTFNGTVDLRGSTIAGAADFSKATFKAPALFGSPTSTKGVRFNGSADFSVASFGGLVTFENSVFARVANFKFTTYAASATFAHDSMHLPAFFNRSEFHGTTDFSNDSFHRAIEFGGTEFSAPVDFRSTFFGDWAFFRETRFDKGATFLEAQFPDVASTSSFVGAQSGGDLDFAFSTIARRIDFSNMVALGALSFREAKLTKDRGVTFQNVSVTSLDLDVGSAVRVIASPDLSSVLGLIESSAKARGDLGVANDAHYERKVLESQQDNWFEHGLDFVFFRTIAGYLVRPLQPLAALLILAAITTGIHVGRRGWPHPAPTRAGARHRIRQQIRRGRRILSPLGDAYFQTLTLIVPGRGPSADERPARWIEALVFRLLFVCVLLGFANSNPTLRQMLDAIH
jgi:uncharacterized protein YjbI with pentapeptide repeats